MDGYQAHAAFGGARDALADGLTDVVDLGVEEYPLALPDQPVDEPFGSRREQQP